MVDKSRNPIWEPSKERIENSNMMAFINFLKGSKGLQFKNYNDLYEWSVKEPADFWETLWGFSGIIHSEEYTSVLEGNDIRTAKWFSGTKLNFAENLLRFNNDEEAIVYWTEDQKPEAFTYNEINQQVAALAHAFKLHGVKQGDRVAALVSNRPEAIIGMLAAASLGAIWSSCSPDFGYQGVLERFGQIKPKILIANNGYSYNGKKIELADIINNISKAIPEIEKIIVVNCIKEFDINLNDKTIGWHDFIVDHPDELTFVQLPFDHPLYIMYSSGTTGKPKCIVHGAGGTLLQHVKELVLHTDLKEEDIITYYTTCGWMMWNWLVSSLVSGATLFIYDGSPSYPNLEILFKAVEQEEISIFGTSPNFLSKCESTGLVPKEKYDMSSLKAILSTGSPLSEENFNYVYNSIKNDVQLSSISGGTDIISCFMLGNPILPVYNGELQCRGLGMKVETYNQDGQPVIDEVGELVCTAPFPSRPVGFWDDENNEKYNKAYFDHYKNVWRHGDYIKINQDGGCIVYGRSDATLNPGGVRIGTAEIYGPVESMKEIETSIVVGRKVKNDIKVVLFVVLKNGYKLDDELKNEIIFTLKKTRSPRHVPAEIHQVDDIPRTINGKKMELAVSNILHGENVSNMEAIANPKSLEYFIQFMDA